MECEFAEGRGEEDDGAFCHSVSVSVRRAECVHVSAKCEQPKLTNIIHTHKLKFSVFTMMSTYVHYANTGYRLSFVKCAEHLVCLGG